MLQGHGHTLKFNTDVIPRPYPDTAAFGSSSQGRDPRGPRDPKTLLLLFLCVVSGSASVRNDHEGAPQLWTWKTRPGASLPAILAISEGAVPPPRAYPVTALPDISKSPARVGHDRLHPRVTPGSQHGLGWAKDLRTTASQLVPHHPRWALYRGLDSGTPLLSLRPATRLEGAMWLELRGRRLMRMSLADSRKKTDPQSCNHWNGIL